jgi:hypothetical protein
LRPSDLGREAMDDNPGFDRNRRMRNIALALALVGLVVLVFLMSVVKWGG